MMMTAIPAFVNFKEGKGSDMLCDLPIKITGIFEDTLTTY
jgi:hypothetical protein